ncbi:MAG: TIM barrel protein [archaeon]
MQAITGVNYPAWGESFRFTKDRVVRTGAAIRRAGAYAMELPADVLAFPCPDKTATELYKRDIQVVGTYFGCPAGGQDTPDWIDQTELNIDAMKNLFPELKFGCLHPWGEPNSPSKLVDAMVQAQLEVAKYAFEHHNIRLGVHTHYGTAIQPVENLRRCIDAIGSADFEGLGLIIDTGHLHSVGDAYFDIIGEASGILLPYAHLKARLSRLDRKDHLHYRADEDPWDSETDMGMVAPDTPGHETPFAEVIEFYRSLDETILAMIELDTPRREPEVEIPADVDYFVNKHGLKIWEPEE